MLELAYLRLEVAKLSLKFVNLSFVELINLMDDILIFLSCLQLFYFELGEDLFGHLHYVYLPLQILLINFSIFFIIFF